MEGLSKTVLSLCMIVKNERQNLPRCLSSVKCYVDEMIVIDTGSEDGTPEIASQYGAKVRYFEWSEDFAAARNYAISQASGDWILVLDADEELIVDSKDFLYQLTLNLDVIAYSIALTESNDTSSTPAYLTRLFRNLTEIKYVGRFHESLKYQNLFIRDSENHGGNFQSFRILHYGYGKGKLLQKNLNRNIPLLERIRQKEGLNLRLLSCLAGMYADTQQPEKAQECSAEVFERLLPNLIAGNPPKDFSFVPDMLYVLGEQALGQKDYETARLLCQRGLQWCPNYPPLNYLAGVTLSALGFLREAVTYFENCITLGQEGSYYKGEPFALAYMTTYPAYDLGCLYIELERPQEALAAFELALSFDANFTNAQAQIENLKQILGNYPYFLQ
jgi:tetratricopeptide (TPR) repeat protein